MRWRTAVRLGLGLTMGALSLAACGDDDDDSGAAGQGGAAGAGGSASGGASGSSGQSGKGGTGGAAAGQGGGSSGAGSGGLSGSSGQASGGQGGASGQGGAGAAGVSGQGGTGTAGAAGSAAGAGGSSGGGAFGVCDPGGMTGTPLIETTAQLITGDPGFHFLEGPVWVRSEGALYFSDMNMDAQGKDGPPSTIHRFTLPGTFSVFLAEAGSNGLTIDPQGTSLIAATHDQQSVSRYDLATKARTTLVGLYQGKKFNSPNDVVARTDGTIYFSDPGWQNANRPSVGMEGIYRLAPGGSVYLVGDYGKGKPNGVALSPDESWLYVGALDGDIDRYKVEADGSTGISEKFAHVDGPDGMAVDCAGNVYVAGSAGVTVLSPKGETLGTITGTGTATNCAFGGPDSKTLFITAGKHLYRVAVGIAGSPS